MDSGRNISDLTTATSGHEVPLLSLQNGSAVTGSNRGTIPVVRNDSVIPGVGNPATIHDLHPYLNSSNNSTTVFDHDGDTQPIFSSNSDPITGPHTTLS